MSSYVGRYHRVRPIGPNGIGAPYVWDRGRAQDAPRMIPAPYDTGETYKGFTRYGEWWRSPEGIWTPAIRGGAGGTYISGALEFPHLYLARAAFGATQEAIALDSAYTYNSAGDAIGNKFGGILVADSIATVYFFITSLTGTAANVNDINLSLRDASVTVGPGSTLIDSVVHDPASTTGWRAATGWTTASVSASTTYWLVVGDADGGITDFATVLRGVSTFGQNPEQLLAFGASTTDGWSATRTFQRASAIVILMTSNRTFGSPFTSSAASTSGTNQRGLRFVAPAGCKFFGLLMTTAVSATNPSGVNLWTSLEGPSGTPAAGTGTVPVTANAVTLARIGMGYETPPTMTQGNVYRAVLAYAAATTIPNRLQIGTGADASLRSAMLGGGAWYWAEANGTTNWANDNTSEFPAVDVIVEDFVTASAAGGGLRLAGHGGLAA